MVGGAGEGAEHSDSSENMVTVRPLWCWYCVWLLVLVTGYGEARLEAAPEAMTVDSTAADGQQRSAPSLGGQGGTGARSQEIYRYTYTAITPRYNTGKPKKDNYYD